VHQLHTIQVHTDDPSSGGRRDKRESSLPRAEVQHPTTAKILVSELVEEHRPERVRILRRVSPSESATHTDKVRHTQSRLRIARREIRGLR
jgi:hypothetical protein